MPHNHCPWNRVRLLPVKTEDGAIVIIECRRYTTSKLKQNAIAALAWIISDVGASGGIVVTPIGVQDGDLRPWWLRIVVCL